MADRLGPLTSMFAELMKTPVGQAWAVQMYLRNPIGITGHRAFDELIRKSQMNKPRPTEYIDTPLGEIIRGDVVQWRNSEFCVLCVDSDEAENHPKDGQVYLWVVQGDNMSTRGRRKSIQGPPTMSMVRRKTMDGVPMNSPASLLAMEPAKEDMSAGEDTGFGTKSENDIDDGPDDFDDAAQ